MNPFMSRSSQLPAPAVVAIVVALVIAAAVARHATTRADATPLAGRGASGTLTFEPGTAALDQQAVLTAIAAARPDARRVVDAIDGLVEIRVGPVGGHA